MLSDLRCLPDLRRLLRRGQFDIVHSNSWKGGLISALARCPGMDCHFIYQPHCTTIHSSPVKRGAKLAYAVERWIARRHDMVVATCETERLELLRSQMCRDTDARIIRVGLDTNCSPVRSNYYRSICGLSADHYPVVGALCRLHSQKGVEFLLRCTAQLSKSFPAIAVMIGGDGPLEVELKALSERLGLQGRVWFLGNVEDCYSMLCDLDIFVLPSLWEAFPAVILEAAVAGLPVVSTTVGGICELIDESTGWLATPGDVGGLVSALTNCIASRNESMGRAVRLRKKVRDSHSLNIMGSDALALYRQLVLPR